MESPALEKPPAIIADMKALGTLMETPPKNVLYPCCGYDASSSEAFPDAHTRYVDMEKSAIAKHKEAGHDAIEARVPTGRKKGESAADDSKAPLYIPKKPVDLLQLFNPGICPDEIAKHVRKKGYLLCNNYHRTADEVRERLPQFDVKGVIAKHGHAPDTKNLQDYFDYVDTDSEWERRNPETFAEAMKIVHPIRGRLRGLFGYLPVLPLYKELLKKGRPDMFSKRKIGKRSIPEPPRKKWGDLFLFQRNG